MYQVSDARLKGHLISKEYISRIDANSRLEAMKTLNDIANKKIKKLMSEKATYKNGKLYAFWLQQFVNSQFAIEVIK